VKVVKSTQEVRVKKEVRMNRKKYRIIQSLILILSLVFTVTSFARGEVIDIAIKGVDDGVKTTKQQDYKEAVLFAKRQAIERAGVEIEAITSVKNLIVQEDYIESKSKGVLLAGYQIIDVGYTEDGTYQVVLVGKLRVQDKTLGKIEQKDVLGWDKAIWGMNYHEVCKLYNVTCSKKPAWSAIGIDYIELKDYEAADPINEITKLFIHKQKGLHRVYQYNSNYFDEEHYKRYSTDKYNEPAKAGAFDGVCLANAVYFEKVEKLLFAKYGKPVLERNDEWTDRTSVWGLPSTAITLMYVRTDYFCKVSLEYEVIE